MSLGSNDDQESSLQLVLIEAASQEAAGSGRAEARRIAEDRVSARQEAERTGQVSPAEEGHVEFYYEDELNGPNHSATHKQLADEIYSELCAEEGVEHWNVKTP